MDSEIYYFTGTGNTLFAAKDIAAALGAKLVPIAALASKQSIRCESEVIGIVYPVYYGELPIMVKQFANRLENLSGKYIFAVCTFGGSSGASLALLNSIIKTRGGSISASYGVHMPQNAFLKPWEANEKILHHWKKKLDRIIENTGAQRKVVYPKGFMKAVITVMHNAFKPLYRSSFAKKTGESPDTPIEELIRLADRSYRTNERCSGCGICARVCPANNIEIREGKPVWLHNCENCLACYAWCPQKAIEGGVAQKNYYYRNSHIAVSEIIGQKKLADT